VDQCKLGLLCTATLGIIIGFTITITGFSYLMLGLVSTGLRLGESW
jgi:hypothetical protein